MEQLVKVTSTPYQSIRFTQNARLIPSDAVDLERRKAMAKHMAFRKTSSGNNFSDMNYINQVNTAFSKRVHSQAAVSVSKEIAPQNQAASNSLDAAAPVPNSAAPTVPVIQSSGISENIEYAAASAQPRFPTEVQANYNVQRGALELRVLNGDLSFVPPIVMTIITQYPSIHFEYTGGFNYVPPTKNSVDGTANYTI